MRNTIISISMLAVSAVAFATPALNDLEKVSNMTGIAAAVQRDVEKVNAIVGQAPVEGELVLVGTGTGPDVFKDCHADAINVRGWSIGEAVEKTNACLKRTYPEAGAQQRGYYVNANSTKVRVACGPACTALADAIVIRIIARSPSVDTNEVSADIRSSLAKRRQPNRLWGHRASVQVIAPQHQQQ
ncbi:MAG: hypothetical protein HY078_13270 [Elusimicrobia bacterium]|nr:hypothetical protein [Elusimicrobiota bacterium]